MTNKLLNTLMASVALIAVAGATTSIAKAGDYRTMGGSLKDPVMMESPVVAAPSGNCYLRGDTGYAGAGGVNSYFYSEVTANVADAHPSGPLDEEDREGSWMLEFGVGCGMDSVTNRFGISGVRIDATSGFRGASAVTGYIPGFGEGNDVTADVTTYTQMMNLYKDFNIGMGSITPYVGVGVGMAYHQMGNVFVNQGIVDKGTDNERALNYVVRGDEDLNFAYSLMAGVSIDVRDNLKFDIGYRFMDMGSVDSNHDLVAISGSQPEDPYLDADMTSHEIKFGLRYTVDSMFGR